MFDYRWHLGLRVGHFFCPRSVPMIPFFCPRSVPMIPSWKWLESTPQLWPSNTNTTSPSKLKYWQAAQCLMRANPYSRFNRFRNRVLAMSLLWGCYHELKDVQKKWRHMDLPPKDSDHCHPHPFTGTIHYCWSINNYQLLKAVTLLRVIRTLTHYFDIVSDISSGRIYGIYLYIYTVYL